MPAERTNVVVAVPDSCVANSSAWDIGITHFASDASPEPFAVLAITAHAN